MIIWLCYLSIYPHLPHTLFGPQRLIGCVGAELRVSSHLTGGEWMLHVATTMTSQDVVLWFIFKLQADVRSVLQAVAVVNYCFELLLCKLVLFFFVSWDLADMHAIFYSSADDWQLLILVAIFMHCKIRYTSMDKCLIFDLMCLSVCVFALGHQRTCRHKFQAHLSVFRSLSRNKPCPKFCV